MGIPLLSYTTEQVIGMAPDASAASASRKLATLLGRDERAMWGECQGSALYQVRVELATMTTYCSCPSRKLPCKHALGLLLLAVAQPDAVPTGEPPSWVTTWLEKRAARRQETSTSGEARVSGEGQKKTADKRLAKVDKGLEQLELWLEDMIRTGLGSIEGQIWTVFEQEAALMVDAQAPGIATRLRRIAVQSQVSRTTQQISEKLLTQLGQLALLIHAYRHIDQLEPALQDEVRSLIGWTLKEDDVIARGEKVRDDWLVVGQITENSTRSRTRRTWLLGTNSGRSAMLLHFAFAHASFPEQYLPGTHVQATVAYWPGAASTRVLVQTQHEAILPWSGSLSAHCTYASIESFLREVATILSQNPWREQFLCMLRCVTPSYVVATHQWYICDQERHALPLLPDVCWKLLALSGGHPVDLLAEWNGEILRPLAVIVEQRYHLLLEGEE